MHLAKIEKISPEAVFVIYKLTETNLASCDISFLNEHDLAEWRLISHPQKQIEWLGARFALKKVLEEMSIPYTSAIKDEFGKPHLIGIKGFISFSHTSQYAAAYYHKDQHIGIDLEEGKSNLLKVKSKFLNEDELKEAGNNLEKLTIYWGAKEAIFKAKGRTGISLKNNIRIAPFVVDQEMYHGKVVEEDSENHYILRKSQIRETQIIYTV